MVEGLIGKKIGMTQQFDDAGNVVPVTVLQAGPCTVIQKKTAETDGYVAVQLGFVEERSVRRPRKPQVGHFKKSGVPVVKKLQEFGCSDPSAVKEGDQILVDIFEVGEMIHVVGTSKGKGFAGVVKRHHFAGGGASHGSMFHRAPGSIGASSYPSRVIKGMRMGGHMGDERITVRDLKVVATDKDKNLLVVKGAVPGAKGGYVLIKKGSFVPARAK
jgi:large subunit ribosomal protein L3